MKKTIHHNKYPVNPVYPVKKRKIQNKPKFTQPDHEKTKRTQTDHELSRMVILNGVKDPNVQNKAN